MTEERQPKFVPQEWQEFFNWEASMTEEERNTRRKDGRWPEGTPQAYIDLQTKLTAEDKLLMNIFEDYPDFQEIVNRPADYLAKQDEERQERQRVRMAKQVGEAVDTSLSYEEIKAKYNEKYPEGIKDEVKEVLGILTERENLIIHRYFGLFTGRPEELEVIAQSMNISPDEVEQSLTRALEKLRHPSQRHTA
ncbi:hypothetical protein HY404_02105 [Candidatus Microgenomates bacterium]|nr:hypothetical protein [Candidatus Microgenomates bacterium]